MSSVKDFQDRFWSKVNIQSNSDCWEWTAGKRHGYGCFRWDSTAQIGAHVASYRLSYSDYKTEFYVCHKCDNKGCVNPYHLFLGTQKDNMIDWKLKNGKPKGNRKNTHWIIITDDTIRLIRNDFKSGLNYPKLSNKYKYALRTIWKIVNFKERYTYVL